MPNSSCTQSRISNAQEIPNAKPAMFKKENPLFFVMLRKAVVK